jgi:hypothetical protein
MRHRKIAGRSVRANRLIVLLGLVGLAASGCAASPNPTIEPPAFDLAAVKRSFTDECKSPTIVDGLFCQQVQVAGMSGVGTILRVPTTLDPAATDRADTICDELAEAHLGRDGKDLGYQSIGILDKDGGNASACTVD